MAAHFAIGQRLDTITFILNRDGFVHAGDATWLRNWLGKDGEPSELLKEALEKHKIDLVTERLTRGSNKAFQTSSFLPSPF